MSGGDIATVTVAVALPPAKAFQVFTAEIDLWWQRGPRFRNGGGASRMVLETGVGGRFVELLGHGAAETAVQIGQVTCWQPPERIEMNWRNSNFSAHEQTRLEIVFAPFGSGTRVTVRHRGWSALPPAHPARHGQQGSVFIRAQGMWWADVLRGYQQRASNGA